MRGLSRRKFLAATAAAAVSVGAPRVHAQKQGATLRFVPHAELRSLDPMGTPAHVTRHHGFMVYDTLFGIDATLMARPQMVEKFATAAGGRRWSFMLRDGLRFHDSRPVTADDAVESLRRWSRRDALGRLLATHTTALSAIDRKTFVLELSQPFGPVLDVLARTFVLPARIASAPETAPLTEPIGSGPFRFMSDEWQPGREVVYVKNAAYKPRAEPASGSTGGKIARLDRVVWRSLPDHAAAYAALEAGEVDWWEAPPLELLGRIEANAALVAFVADPHGTQGWVRPNHKQPPFDNVKARQALLHAVDQRQFLRAAIGVDKYCRPCPAMFACGGPFESAVGAPRAPDLGRARALVRDSGYDGRPVVVLAAAEITLTTGAARVTRDALTEIGFNVDVQTMEWTSVVARRARKEAPGHGGWNVVFTWWPAWELANPAVHPGVSGAGDGAWFGWPESVHLESLRRDWLHATDATTQTRLADDIQRLAYEEVTYVPFGQWALPTAHRKGVSGVLQFSTPLFWNVALG